MESIPHILVTYGYLGVFLLLMVGIVGVPVPDEVILILAGYLVFIGRFQPLPTVAAAVLGTFCGITVSYSLGRSAGAYLLRRYGHLLRVTPKKLAKAQAWFYRVGKWALFWGYFVTGLRHLTALAAGSSRVRFRTFALFAYPGGFLWALSFLFLGYFLGEELPRVMDLLTRLFFVISGLAVLLVIGLVWRKHFQNQGLAS